MCVLDVSSVVSESTNVVRSTAYDGPGTSVGRKHETLQIRRRGTYKTANNNNPPLTSQFLNPSAHKQPRQHADADEAAHERIQCHNDIAEWARRLVGVCVAVAEEVGDWFGEAIEAVAGSDGGEESVDVKVECEEGAGVHFVWRGVRKGNGQDGVEDEVVVMA